MTVGFLSQNEKLPNHNSPFPNLLLGEKLYVSPTEIRTDDAGGRAGRRLRRSGGSRRHDN
jgi:hypothetical protein